MAHLSEAAVVKINEICDRYVNEKTPLIMILSDIQKEYGYIPLEVQEIVSERTGISVAEIYGVVTFYSFFSLKPNGKYVIGCCLGTACYVKGAQQIVDKFSEILGIKPGETTEDGLFTIDALRCIGACAIAPAVTINGKVYPHVEVSEVQGIVDEYKAKADAVSQAEIYRTYYAISTCSGDGVESPTVIGAQAANELLNIKGIKASFVFSQSSDAHPKGPTTSWNESPAFN